jgi:hypothetical protein
MKKRFRASRKLRLTVLYKANAKTHDYGSKMIYGRYFRTRIFVNVRADLVKELSSIVGIPVNALWKASDHGF